MYEAEPVFEEFDRWNSFVSGGRLGGNAQRFVDRISELVGVGFDSFGTGPGVDDVIQS